MLAPINELQAKIQAFIQNNKQDYVKNLARVISHRSVEGVSAGIGAPFGEGVRAALDETLAIAKEMGLETHNLDGYIGWAEVPGEKSDYISTIAHLDVVPEGQGWSSDPYTLLEKDGWLIGRGVEDNKGPAILSLYIAKFFKENNIPLKYSFRALLGTNEESGMQDVSYYLAKQPAPLFCFTPDAQFPVCYGEKGVYSGDIISEPLNGNIIEFNAGIASNVVPDRATCLVKGDVSKLQNTKNVAASNEGGNVRLNAKGIGGHAAMPADTLNAIGLMVNYLLDNKLCTAKEETYLTLIKSLNATTGGEALGIDCSDDIFGALTCIGGIIQLEDSRLVQNINVRMPTAITSETATATIQKVVAQYSATFKLHRGENAFHVDPNSGEIQALLQTYNDIMGENAEPFTMGGGTYARHFLKAAAFGPIDSENIADKPDFVGTIHGANEGAYTDSLMKSMEIFIISLWRLQQLNLS